MTDEFVRMYEAAKVNAEALFARDGYCAFVAIVSQEREATVKSLEFHHRDAKAAAYAALRSQFPMADWFVVVSECWMATRKPGDKSGPMPADDPMREEAVLVQGAHRDGRRLGCLYAIQRDGDLATLAAAKEMPETMDSMLATVMFDG